MPFRSGLEDCAHDTSPLTEIISHENPSLTNWGSGVCHLSNGLTKYDAPITWRATGINSKICRFLRSTCKISRSPPGYFAVKLPKKLSWWARGLFDRYSHALPFFSGPARTSWGSSTPAKAFNSQPIRFSSSNYMVSDCVLHQGGIALDP